VTETNMDGALAAALAKAQGAFPAISRDKEVTVQTKTSGSYKFKYAPLDSILNAVRAPLADNGLALTQLLDGADLVTMLLHKDGASLSGRLPLPHIDGNVQALGSAITYLRRYSIQAILGIAAEEDDDGNGAAGNRATFRPREDSQPELPEHTPEGGLIGTAIAQGNHDFNLRQTPEGWVLPFRVKNGSSSFIVRAENDLAQALDAIKATVIDQRVQVWGTWKPQTTPAKGTRPAVNYRILVLERIATPDGILPAPAWDNDEPPLEEPPDDVSLIAEAPTAPLGLVG
jgi:hypothetical protein